MFWKVIILNTSLICNLQLCFGEKSPINCKSTSETQDTRDVRPKITEDEIHDNLNKRISSIRNACGEVCDTSIKGTPGTYYDEITKDFDCHALFSNSDIDFPGEFQQPPMKIPDYLKDDFSYNGQLRIEYFYQNDAGTLETDWNDYTLADYERFYYENLNGKLIEPTFNELSTMLDNHFVVKGKKILVIGSQNPWIETILLKKGANLITTLDYTKIKCNHPKIETLTPDQMAKRYLEKKVQYDIMVTYSSVEHSGLGRYGDMLNPWGDLIAMARAWCLVKPGGKALVGVPSGPDTVIFNSHRLYGPLSYAHLFANWIVDYTDNDFTKFNESGCNFCYHPFHVLQKIN